MATKTVVISGAAGAWGDSALSTPQLLADGRSDYIMYEGLAEITMAILTRARAKDSARGYARDLIETIAANLAAYREAGMRVVTNAGGVNPEAAATLIREAAREGGLDLSIGVVQGDDLMGSDGIAIPEGAISMNAYLGARPIAAALDSGADVVVTGRVVDSALVLGPLIHEFGWGHDEYDKLSAGSLVGHLLECGPQATGGLFTDWEETSSWAEPGYPVAEVASDGTFLLTTPKDSEGIVRVATAAEQLLYEIGDPAAYVLPDVVCDWTQVRIEQAGEGVEVSGARGNPPTPTLKACAQVPDGWRAQFLLFIGGRQAVAKARRVGDDLIARGERLFELAGLPGFRSTSIEVLGAEDTYGPHARTGDAREVVLKIGVHHDAREAVEAFLREVPSIALAGPPGVSGGGAGLPRPTPLIRLECVLIARDALVAEVRVDGTAIDLDDVDLSTCVEVVGSQPEDEEVTTPSGPTVEVPLIAIAHGRSGDKGADVNVGIRARHPVFLLILAGQITSARVGQWLSHLGTERVDRFRLPGIDAFNFLLTKGLGAGGTASLRFDPQGKAVAQQMLDMPVAIPADLLDHPSIRAVPEVVRLRSE
ncbi:MAG: acyclic terpene utilization AtuA family protein [Actinomycetota bacterium]|nr:acyclic terpene utilization AtuA family protein [Actinomycetota bacterium]